MITARITRSVNITLALLAFGAQASAQTTRPIIIAGTPVSIPVPDGYTDTSVTTGAPEYVSIFETTIVEPWEEAAELNEGILFYGVGLKPTEENIKQQKFEQIFGLFVQKVKAKMDSKPFAMQGSLIKESLIDSIYANSLGNNAEFMDITDNRNDRKAILINTSLIMPGVISYPLIEEISFVRIHDRVLIFHLVRIDYGDVPGSNMSKSTSSSNVRKTGLKLRDDIVSAN